jgi:2-methylisocitrate lyase-like PEP mutase family enzyme
VVAAVSPKPVNLLIGGPSAFKLDELAKLGVRRVSVGGAFARAALGGLVTSVQSLANGRFDSSPKEPSGAWLNDMLQDLA